MRLPTPLRHFFLVALACFACSCASSHSRQLVPAPVAGGAPPPTQSRVYIMRESTFKAGGVPALGADGDRIVGVYGPKEYLVWDRPAGHAKVTAALIRGKAIDRAIRDQRSTAEIVALHALGNPDFSSVKGVIEFDAKPGETVYLKHITEIPGVFSFDNIVVRLERMSEPEATRILRDRVPIGKSR